ncbi:MAG: hypothetical protein IJV15_09220 [Lachnospiraceae bacterium]|nr:hypothetical protein [Lachnospiraceae bacterium]
MLAINARTGELIVDNFDRKGSIKGTGFNEKEYQKLIDCKDGVILIHNHSLNGLPSSQDLLTYLKNEHIKLSIIVCHDGTVYGIYSVNSEFEKVYNDYFNQEKELTNNIDDAKRLTTTKLYLINEKMSKSNKLFDVKKL